MPINETKHAIEVSFEHEEDYRGTKYTVDFETNNLRIVENIENEKSVVNIEITELLDVVGLISKKAFSRSQSYYQLPY